MRSRVPRCSLQPTQERGHESCFFLPLGIFDVIFSGIVMLMDAINVINGGRCVHVCVCACATASSGKISCALAQIFAAPEFVAFVMFIRA